MDTDEEGGWDNVGFEAAAEQVARCGAGPAGRWPEDDGRQDDVRLINMGLAAAEQVDSRGAQSADHGS
jgi:hypothetical protein